MESPGKTILVTPIQDNILFIKREKMCYFSLDAIYYHCLYMCVREYVKQYIEIHILYCMYI
jgi:hypothetical protein